MKELTNLRVKDEVNGKVYRLIGFNVGGDDRAGFPVTSVILYDDAERIRYTITSPVELKRLTLIRE